MKAFTAACVIAVAQAAFPVAPSSPRSHALFCQLFDEDLNYGPCPEGENLSFDSYPDGYFDQFSGGISGTGNAAEPEVEEKPRDGNNKEYLESSGFAKLYPFASISFFDGSTHPGTFVVSDDKKFHEPATPEECDPCKALRELVDA